MTPLANGWLHVAVPLSDIDPRGVAISGVQLKNATGSTLAAINIDDVRFVRQGCRAATSHTARDTNSGRIGARPGQR